ncbi:hypothetical protein CBM2626_B110295 [Cupriavidus taiwanensis]|nr:hypothetical protein CBM2626_B110295 [Cupriavidus taiwanensis]
MGPWIAPTCTHVRPVCAPWRQFESYYYIMSATDGPNSAAFVPNENERKKILFWLKQVSLYTA